MTLIAQQPPASEYILRGNNFVRRTITEEVIGGQEDILGSLVEPAPILLSNVHTLNQKPIHVAVSNGMAVIVTELASLPMNVGMFLNEAGTTLYPLDRNAFTPTHSVAGMVRIRDPWTPPPGLKLYLFLYCTMAGGQPSANTPYLLCRMGRGEFMAMYYPNVYDNGRICMGTDWENNKNRDCPTLVEKFIRTYSSFHNSAMNSDLTGAAHLGLYRRSVVNGIDRWLYETDERHYGAVTSLSFLPQFRNI